MATEEGGKAFAKAKYYSSFSGGEVTEVC